MNRRQSTHLEEDPDGARDLREALDLRDAEVSPDVVLADPEAELCALAHHRLRLLVDPHDGRLGHGVHLAAQRHVLAELRILVARGQPERRPVCGRETGGRSSRQEGNGGRSFALITVITTTVALLTIVVSMKIIIMKHVNKRNNNTSNTKSCKNNNNYHDAPLFDHHYDTSHFRNTYINEGPSCAILIRYTICDNNNNAIIIYQQHNIHNNAMPITTPKDQCNNVRRTNKETTSQLQSVLMNLFGRLAAQPVFTSPVMNLCMTLIRA